LAKITVPQGGEDLDIANIAPGNTATLEAKVIGGARILWRIRAPERSGASYAWRTSQAIVHFQLLGDLMLGGCARR
jgi:hypothetical protein